MNGRTMGGGRNIVVLLMLREEEYKANLHEPVLVHSFERGWNVRTAPLAQDAVEGYRHIFDRF